MKPITPLLIFILISIALTAKSNTFEESIHMEHFNVEKFYQFQKGGEWTQVLSDGCEVRQIENPSRGFIEEKKPKNSPYTYRKAFDSNGNLIGVTTEFYSFPIGMSKLYDSQGRLIREDNNDNDFKFSVENLADKMNVEFSINIMDSNNIVNVVRGVGIENLKDPVYVVYAYINDKPSYIRNYLINGNTGKLLFMLDIAEGERKSVFDEYLKSLKTK